MAEVPCVVQIVGVLSDTAVDDGDTVAEGDLLCMVECMKTMFPIYAPAAGRVGFRFSLGELLGEGDVVAVIETV